MGASLTRRSARRDAHVHEGPECDSGNYRIVLEMHGGELFPLTESYSLGKKNHEQVAAAVRSALVSSAQAS